MLRSSGVHPLPAVEWPGPGSSLGKHLSVTRMRGTQAGRSCRPMPVEMNSDSDDGKHKYFTGKFKLVRLGVLVWLLELGARRRRTGMSKNGANLNEEPFNSVLFKLYSASLCN